MPVYKYNPRLNANYISRQNDPAYNRDVQYTYKELTIKKYSNLDVIKTVKMLCSDQKRNYPNVPDNISTGRVDLRTFNGIVEYWMALATPVISH